MKTYNVKQVAELLGTSQETVRRWIRDGKLKAVQVSRKNGNVISETELDRFIKRTPKYLPNIIAGIGAAVPLPAIKLPAIAGSAVAKAILEIYEENDLSDTRVSSKDLVNYLQDNIAKLNSVIKQKQALIKQTQEEINMLSEQVDQYKFLLKREIEKSSKQ